MPMNAMQQNRIAAILREGLTLALMMASLLAARSTLADHYYVPSGSMENTLFPGDRVLVDKRAYGYRIPFTNREILAVDPVDRGDVVIFDSPRDGVRLIKRIVAIGGDHVRIENDLRSGHGRLLSSRRWIQLDSVVRIRVGFRERCHRSLRCGF